MCSYHKKSYINKIDLNGVSISYIFNCSHSSFIPTKYFGNSILLESVKVNIDIKYVIFVVKI